jgi:hypothetical protein
LLNLLSKYLPPPSSDLDDYDTPSDPYRDEVVVSSYNKIAGRIFRFLWSKLQTSWCLNLSSTVMALTEASLKFGLTNQQTAEVWIAIAGAVAPCLIVLRDQNPGFICPGAL